MNTDDGMLGQTLWTNYIMVRQILNVMNKSELLVWAFMIVMNVSLLLRTDQLLVSFLSRAGDEWRGDGVPTNEVVNNSNAHFGGVEGDLRKEDQSSRILLQQSVIVKMK